MLATAEQLGLESLVLQIRREVRDVREEVREPAMTDWLKLNVGGRMFESSRATLTSDSNSILSRMFESDCSLLHFPPISLSQGRLF